MATNGFTHDNVANKTVDWYTPAYVVDTLRRCGAHFTLDPCAPVGGVPWLNMPKSYSLHEDGLAQSWACESVWLNPPYGRYTPAWLEKLAVSAKEGANGIALVFARTDCGWFHDATKFASGILFLKGRIKFVDGLGKTAGNGAGAGSMLIAYGAGNAAVLRQAAQTEALSGLFVELDGD